jgi:type IV pilus biogenesis protein CpaD/CtpE
MVKTLRYAARSVVLAVACAAAAACANSPSSPTEPDYRSQRSPTPQGENSTAGQSGQRLTIQSGEGEKLNLPWFIQDTQNWINSN